MSGAEAFEKRFVKAVSGALDGHMEKRSMEIGISRDALEAMIAKELDEMADGIRKKVCLNDPT